MHLLHVCAYYMYALITGMQNPCRDQRSLNTTGLQCMCFSQQQSSTDLHVVACTVGKLTDGTKIRASHYRVHFTLSAGTADYLATCSYLLKCCSVPYVTVRSITLFCTQERAGLGCISEGSARTYVRTCIYTVTRMRLLCRVYERHKNVRLL